MVPKAMIRIIALTHRLDPNHHPSEMFTRKYIDIRGNQYFKQHLSRFSALQIRYIKEYNENP